MLISLNVNLISFSFELCPVCSIWYDCCVVFVLVLQAFVVLRIPRDKFTVYIIILKNLS